MKLRSTPQSEDALMIITYCKFTPNRKQLPKQLPPPLHMARTWMDMHRLRRLHDSQYIMKNPFTNENSNLSNIFHNNIHRKKVESLKVRSTEEFLCQFAWLPCRFFRGRRQGRQPLNIYIYMYPMYGRFTTHQSEEDWKSLPPRWAAPPTRLSPIASPCAARRYARCGENPKVSWGSKHQ